jgi:hypothetical protein
MSKNTFGAAVALAALGQLAAVVGANASDCPAAALKDLSVQDVQDLLVRWNLDLALGTEFQTQLVDGLALDVLADVPDALKSTAYPRAQPFHVAALRKHLAECKAQNERAAKAAPIRRSTVTARRRRLAEDVAAADGIKIKKDNGGILLGKDLGATIVRTVDGAVAVSPNMNVIGNVDVGGDVSVEGHLHLNTGNISAANIADLTDSTTSLWSLVGDLQDLLSAQAAALSTVQTLASSNAAAIANSASSLSTAITSLVATTSELQEMLSSESDLLADNTADISALQSQSDDNKAAVSAAAADVAANTAAISANAEAISALTDTTSALQNAVASNTAGIGVNANDIDDLEDAKDALNATVIENIEEIEENEADIVTLFDAVAVLDALVNPNDQRVVYASDVRDGVFSEWKFVGADLKTITCGDYVGIGGNLGSGDSISTYLHALPAHSEIVVKFTFISIDGWDGEKASCFVDSTLAWNNTFSSTTGSSNLCGSSSFKERTETVTTTTLSHFTLGASLLFNATIDQACVATASPWSVLSVCVFWVTCGACSQPLVNARRALSPRGYV